jgi:hypothetical protein
MRTHGLSKVAWLAGCVGIGTWATQAVFRNLKVKTLDGAILYEGIPENLTRRNTASFWKTPKSIWGLTG